MLKPIVSPAETAQLKKMFSEARQVVLTCHTSPDGDAIGSCLALQEYLVRRGKQATVIVPNYFPDFLRWMNGADRIIQYNRNYTRSKTLIAQADLVVCLDYNEPSRIDDMQTPFRFIKGRKLMIDHHENPAAGFCDLTLSRPEMSSTCELLFRLFVALDDLQNVNRHAAEDLYAGMCTDTGRFTYNSNNPEIFIIIAELMKKGIDKDRIIRNIYNQNTEGRYRLMGYILYEKLIVMHDLHASISSVTKDELQRFHYLKGDAEGIVNMPLEIRGQKLSIMLREDTEKPQICVSIRSYDDFPANEMATRFFNGGGHFNAAGGRLFCTMDEALEIAKQAVEAYRPLLCKDDPTPAE